MLLVLQIIDSTYGVLYTVLCSYDHESHYIFLCDNNVCYLRFKWNLLLFTSNRNVPKFPI